MGGASKDTVRSWSHTEVAEWLTSLNLGEPAQQFEKHRVDGDALLQLQKHELRDELGIMSIKDRKAVWGHVSEVQGTAGTTDDPTALGTMAHKQDKQQDEEYDAVDEVIGDTEVYQAQIKDAAARVAEEADALEREHQSKVESVERHFAMLQAELTQRKESVVLQLDSIRSFKRDALAQQQDRLQKHGESLEAAVEDVRVKLESIKGTLDRETADLLKQRLGGVERVAVPIRPCEEAFINCFMEKRAFEDVEMVQRLGYVEPHPQSQGEVFEHRYDFDEHGILHYIGRCYGREAEYRNPGAPLDAQPPGRQLIEVRSSTIEFGAPWHGIVHPCLDPESGPTQTFLSQDEQHAWLSLAFGPKYVVCPSHYTVRNSTVVPGHSLSNWALEGSKDGHKWALLCEHTESTALTPQRGSVATFEVRPRCVTFYHRLRLKLTGPNYHVAPHTRFHYLMLSGLEIYGTLKTVKTDKPLP